jgi:hypothetical protein
MFNKPTSEPVWPEQNKMEPVGPGPKIRPVGLGLHALFSKKPEPEPDLWARAQARPTSTHKYCKIAPTLHHICPASQLLNDVIFCLYLWPLL